MGSGMIDYDHTRDGQISPVRDRSEEFDRISHRAAKAGIILKQLLINSVEIVIGEDGEELIIPIVFSDDD